MFKKATAAAIAAMLVVPAAGAVTTPEPPRVFVFNGEGNRLNVYDHLTGEERTLIISAADAEAGVDPAGREVRDINAQICFHEFGGKRYFIAGEDTAQGGEEGAPGWGWFELRGDRLATFATTQRGKLVPTYAEDGSDNPENYGCGFLDSGNLLLSDVGDQQPGTPGNGQLHIWFPHPGRGFGKDFAVSPNGVPLASDVSYCKIDTMLPTAGGIWVDQGDPGTAADDVVYVASARPETAPPDEWGIFRYDGLGRMGPECDGAKAGLRKTLVIPGGATGFTPNAVVGSADDTLYVTSVFDGNIAEYTKGGRFVRWIVGGTPTGQVSGFLPPPLTVGTPLGLGVTPDGWVYYADIGVVGNGPIRPGRVMRVRPGASNVPSTPEVVDEDLAFPDGIGVLVL